MADTELDRIFVVVNEDVITQSEIERELRVTIYELRSRGQVIPPISELKGDVIDNIVLQKLQLQKALKLGLTINEDELTLAIKDIAKRNNLSALRLREEIEKTGLSYDEYRQELTLQLLTQKLVEQEINRYVRVTEADIKDYLENNPRSEDRVEYELSHVLIEIKDSEEKALSIAKDIYERISSGTPFALIATEMAGIGLARDTSKLGWRNSDQLPDIFVEAIRNLSVGGVSPPIQSQNGFHILRLTGKRGEGSYTVDQKRVRHILVVEDELTDKAKIIKRLLRIRQRIIAGEDFGDIARLQSSDVSSRVLGGDLGWLSPDDLELELESILGSLPMGEISMPIQTKFGYHLIQVTGTRTHDIGDQLQRQKARLELRSEKFNQQYKVWKKKLLSKAWIDYRVSDED
jgi:peptidyl-prolyl cis-trans isomerase SurA